MLRPRLHHLARNLKHPLLRLIRIVLQHISAIPNLATKQLAVLRDGAAAQYGSDAIAGVLNFELNDASEGVT
jgi:outer membrane receptor protein involved in Fe transport